jgi:Hydrolase N-terminal helical domain
VQLRYISQDLLVGEAGGDPWAIDKSLQTGRPAQIADLAQAFHNASQCTKEADTAFVEACRRFESSWNRENGEYPINDSAEVQRATRLTPPGVSGDSLSWEDVDHGTCKQVSGGASRAGCSDGR